jgi:hypothetical protein
MANCQIYSSETVNGSLNTVKGDILYTDFRAVKNHVTTSIFERLR